MTSRRPRAEPTVAVAVAAVGFALALAGAAAGCLEPSDESPYDAEAEVGDEATFDNVQAIFDANCALSGCHGGAIPVLYSLQAGRSYAQIVDVPSSDLCFNLGPGGAPLDRIEPGDPDASCIVRAIEGAVQPRMPLGGELSPGEIALIRRWVEEGANP